MPDTPRGYPYPPGTGVAPAGHLQMQALAEAIDGDITATEADLSDRLEVIEAWQDGRVVPYREHYQVVTVTIPSGTNSATATFALPAGRFTASPAVECSIHSPSFGAMPGAAMNAGSLTAGTVRVSLPANVGAATNIPVLLHAVQMTPTAALG